MHVYPDTIAPLLLKSPADEGAPTEQLGRTGMIEAGLVGGDARITITRNSKDDVGFREIFVSIDGEPPALLRHGDALTREVAPGPHRLEAHNTLFRKRLEVTLNVGEHASFTAINRAGWGTYSPLAFLVGFLGAGPFYLTFVREPDAVDRRAIQIRATPAGQRLLFEGRARRVATLAAGLDTLGRDDLVALEKGVTALERLLRSPK